MHFRLRNSQPINVVERTSPSFSREDLAVLARPLQVGQPQPPVIARLKTAMTRHRLQTPDGV
jgi:hypothetical protein